MKRNVKSKTVVFCLIFAMLISGLGCRKKIDASYNKIKAKKDVQYNKQQSVYDSLLVCICSDYDSKLKQFDKINNSKIDYLGTKKNKISLKLYKGVYDDIYSHPLRANESFFQREYVKLTKYEKKEFTKLIKWGLKEDWEYDGPLDFKYISDMYDMVFNENLIYNCDNFEGHCSLFNAIYDELMFNPEAKEIILLNQTTGHELVLSRTFCEKLVVTNDKQYDYSLFCPNANRNKKCSYYKMWNWINLCQPEDYNSVIQVESVDTLGNFQFDIDTSNIVIKKKYLNIVNDYLLEKHQLDSLVAERDSIVNFYENKIDSLNTKKEDLKYDYYQELLDVKDSLYKKYYKLFYNLKKEKLL